MKTITTYIANDGTEFNNEWECQDYEAEQEARKYQDTAILLDEDGERLPLCDDSFQEAFYIKAVTDEAARFMAERFVCWSTPWNEYGIEPHAGIWAFFNEEWTQAEEIEKVYKIIRKIS